MKRLFFLFVILLFSSFAPDYTCRFGLLKYNGGGDWYVNLETSLRNLALFCNKQLGTNINPEQGIVEAGSPELFNYPFVHLTGHGNVIFSVQEAQNLRNYLIGGGFLHISDSYGLDQYIRPQMKKVFPELEMTELPFSHPVYHQKFSFASGLPKIHEHNNKAPQGFGLIWEGRLVCFYDFECDLGDGWEDFDVHKDSPETHEKALRMGANIVQYVFMN